MAKFFAVELTTTAIVQVEDHQTWADAEVLARRNERDILNDCPDMDVSSCGEVKHLGALSAYGWDGMCLPYGGDGNTRLQDLLPTDKPPPARCPHTAELPLEADGVGGCDEAQENKELADTAMRFVDRAGDVCDIDPAEKICAEFHAAMSAVVFKYHPLPERQHCVPVLVMADGSPLLDYLNVPDDPPNTDEWTKGFHEARRRLYRILAPQITPGVGVLEPQPPRKPTDPEVAEWAERHDLRGSATDLRCAFEDAQTLHMADGVRVLEPQPVAWMTEAACSSPVVTDDFLKQYPQWRSTYTIPLYRNAGVKRCAPAHRFTNKQIEEIAGTDELTGDAILDFAHRLLNVAYGVTVLPGQQENKRG